MDVTYRLDEQHLRDVQAQLVLLRRAEHETSVGVYLVAVGVAAVAAWPIAALVFPGRPLVSSLRYVLLAFVVAATIAALLKPTIIRMRPRSFDAWAVRRLTQASLRRSVLGPVTVTVSDEGIRRRNDKGEVSLRWADVRDALASQELLTIRPRGRGPVVLLPAGAFGDASAFAAARARVEALLGAPAIEVDLERRSVTRPGPVRSQRKIRPELVAALGIALGAVAVDRVVARVYDPRRGNPPGHVVLYATSWCPVCATLRTCLEDSGVVFEERDVERSRAADVEWRALGSRGVPVTLVGGEAVFGLDRGRLAAVLGSAGHEFSCPGDGAGR